MQKPSVDLPGKVVALDDDQCMALLHTRNPDEAKAILNRVASTQHPIDSSLVFRTTGGMGSLVGNHFEGRQEEMQKASNAIHQADEEVQGILIIGGRRMGKTSFRERIKYEMDQERTTEGSPRLFLLLDLQAFPRDVNLSQSYVEYRLFKHLYNALKDTAYPFPQIQQWPDSQKDSPLQRDKARDLMRSHLKAIKVSTGKAPVLILDETERFAEIDSRNGFLTMDFVRELAYSQLICLVATSYPHGKGQSYALQNLINDSGSPYYNTFTTTLYMTRWMGDTAWNYLKVKLSGFGIALPLYLRDDMLHITRGVPWLVHQLGQDICQVSGEIGPRRLISRTQWQKVRQETLAMLRSEIRTTVDSRAEEIDRQYFVHSSRRPDARLANGHLWGAFVAIAKGYQVPSVWDKQEDKRGTKKPLCRFSVGELYKAFAGETDRERINAVLNRLTASAVLEGDEQDSELFYFSNDLLPMVVQELEDDRP